MGFVGYSLLIFFPESSAVASVALVILVTSLGGLQNVFLLICEMCVPPSNIAAVAIMIRTIGQGAGVFASQIVALEPLHTYILLLSIAVVSFICSIFLPEPGLHLSQVQTSDEKNNTVKMVCPDKKSFILPKSII